MKERNLFGMLYIICSVQGLRFPPNKGDIFVEHADSLFL
jgi:hypothetical protein